MLKFIKDAWNVIVDFGKTTFCSSNQILFSTGKLKTMAVPRWLFHDGCSTMAVPRWLFHDGFIQRSAGRAAPCRFYPCLITKDSTNLRNIQGEGTAAADTPFVR
jgi:hypothetical protein